MADTLTKAQRSAHMAKIRGRDTRVELAVRRLVYSLGYRYRLHGRDLPGRPDLVFRRLRKVIFVHGCFWHQHVSMKCRGARVPKSRVEYWQPKLQRNKQRDAATNRQLRQTGWKVLVLWECQVSNHAVLAERIRRFLGPVQHGCG